MKKTKEGPRDESWAMTSLSLLSSQTRVYATPLSSLPSALRLICKILICLGTSRRDVLGSSWAASPCSWGAVLWAMLCCCAQRHDPYLGTCQRCSLLRDFHMLGLARSRSQRAEWALGTVGRSSHKHHLTERVMVSSAFRDSSWNRAQKFSAAIITLTHHTETLRHKIMQY